MQVFWWRLVTLGGTMDWCARLPMVGSFCPENGTPVTELLLLLLGDLLCLHAVFSCVSFCALPCLACGDGAVGMMRLLGVLLVMLALPC